MLRWTYEESYNRAPSNARMDAALDEALRLHEASLVDTFKAMAGRAARSVRMVRRASALGMPFTSTKVLPVDGEGTSVNGRGRQPFRLSFCSGKVHPGGDGGATPPSLGSSASLPGPRVTSGKVHPTLAEGPSQLGGHPARSDSSGQLASPSQLHLAKSLTFSMAASMGRLQRGRGDSEGADNGERRRLSVSRQQRSSKGDEEVGEDQGGLDRQLVQRVVGNLLMRMPELDPGAENAEERDEERRALGTRLKTNRPAGVAEAIKPPSSKVNGRESVMEQNEGPAEAAVSSAAACVDGAPAAPPAAPGGSLVGRHHNPAVLADGVLPEDPHSAETEPSSAPPLPRLPSDPPAMPAVAGEIQPDLVAGENQPGPAAGEIQPDSVYAPPMQVHASLVQTLRTVPTLLPTMAIPASVEDAAMREISADSGPQDLPTAVASASVTIAAYISTTPSKRKAADAPPLRLPLRRRWRWIVETTSQLQGMVRETNAAIEQMELMCAICADALGLRRAARRQRKVWAADLAQGSLQALLAASHLVSLQRHQGVLRKRITQAAGREEEGSGRLGAGSGSVIGSGYMSGSGSDGAVMQTGPAATAACNSAGSGSLLEGRGREHDGSHSARFCPHSIPDQPIKGEIPPQPIQPLQGGETSSPRVSLGSRIPVPELPSPRARPQLAPSLDVPSPDEEPAAAARGFNTPAGAGGLGAILQDIMSEVERGEEEGAVN